MLYYCVCFEASSLVISGQPCFCFFSFFPLWYIPAPQLCTVYHLSVQFCSPERWVLFLGLLFLFFHTQILSWKTRAHTTVVPSLTTVSVIFNRSHCHLMYIIIFCYTESLCTYLWTQSRCLPACLPAWPVPLLSRMLILKRFGERESLSCMPELSQRAYRASPFAYMRVSVQSQRHKYQIFFSVSRRESSSSCRFLNLKRRSLTLSIKSAVHLRGMVWQFGGNLMAVLPRIDTSFMSVRQI